MVEQVHGSGSETAVEPAWVNPRDPAKRLGPGRPPGGQPPRADAGRTSPTRSGTTGAGSSSNRVNDLEEIEQILDLTDEEREGLSAPGQVPGRRHALLHQPDRPRRPERPDPPPDHPARPRAAAFTGMMEDSLAEDRHSPVPGLVHRYPDRVLMLDHDPVRELLPLLHAEPDRRRPDPELQPQGARGPARLHPPDPPDPRRADLRRRRADAGAEAARERRSAACARSRTSRSSASARGCRCSCPSGSTTSCARCSRSTTRCG